MIARMLAGFRTVPLTAVVLPCLVCFAFLVALALVPCAANNPTAPQDPGGNCVGSSGGSGAPADHSPPGGWGWDCSDWIRYSDPWCSGEMLFNPLAGGTGGAGEWDVCGPVGPAGCAALSIELWVEMECEFCWDATHAQIHRASDYSDFVLYFCGTSACNNGQQVIVMPPAEGTLAYLKFVQDIFGNPSSACPIPLAWHYSVDGAPYALMMNLPLVPGLPPTGGKYFTVEACDHSFCIRVTGDLKYHQEDGYYTLSGDGAYILLADPL